MTDVDTNIIQFSSTSDPLGDRTSATGADEDKKTPDNKRIAQGYITNPHGAQSDFMGGLSLNSSAVFEQSSGANITIAEIITMLDRDGQARSAFQAVVGPLKSLPYKIKPWEDPDKPYTEEGRDDPSDRQLDPATQLPKPKKPKPRDTKGLDEASFIRKLFTQPAIAGGMSHSFHKFVEETLLALRDGFSCFEKVWRVTDEGKWVIDRLSRIPSSEVAFLIHRKTKRLRYVKQRRYGAYRSSSTSSDVVGDIRIPAEKAFTFTVAHADNPFYGKSILTPAYYHYDKKHKLYYISHLAYALNAIAARVGEYPRRATKDQIDKFQQDLANFGTNTSMTVPEGFIVHAFEQNRSLVDLMPAINHHDQQITKSILPHMIGIGIQPTPVGDDKGFLTMFQLFLNGIMADLADAINRDIIPELIQYNFGTEHYPTIEFDAVPMDRVTLAQETFTRLIATKSVAPSAEFLQGLEEVIAGQIGLEIDYDAKDASDFRPPEVNASGALPGAGRPRAGTNEPISTDPKERATQDATRSKSATKTNASEYDIDVFVDKVVAMLQQRSDEIKDAVQE